MDLPDLRTVDLDGPVAYREWDGDRRTTFVLVHGLGGSQLSWSLVASGLAGLGRVLALDLIGFGATAPVGRATGLMDQRRMLSRFLQERAGGRVILCGNSMGGALSMLQAAVAPDSVAGITLTCSVFPPVRGGVPNPIVGAVFGLYGAPRLGDWFVQARFHRGDVDRLVRAGFAVIAADPRSIPEDVIRATIELERVRRTDPGTPEAFLGAARSMLRLGRRPDVSKRAMDNVRCPVLVLHGRRDRLVPAAWAQAAVDSHPSWRYRFFADLGHVPQLEAPGRWLSAVADWFAESID
ncbi:MAG TPA: alpha/beta fold hydrolase [Actinomycetota bacterium]|jgi:pimeloyl-ACP methyl ester carboxylesterase|nr:alpha/beta fold hydrolase [Actinomycetota bacterium]